MTKEEARELKALRDTLGCLIIWLYQANGPLSKSDTELLLKKLEGK